MSSVVKKLDTMVECPDWLEESMKEYEGLNIDKMSEEEFVKELGFDPKIGEDKAIRIALYNIIIEIMKLKLKNQETIKTMQAVLTLALDEKEKGENNGK